MHFRRAFSLVELSIVLVILGLLVGGVLTGQSLIRASELRSITTEYNRYFTSVRAFRDKYFALPGDMNNATQFWGIADPDPQFCKEYNGLPDGTKTCNGDGNGRIAESAESWEAVRAWQHLANAGIIEGVYANNSDGPCLSEPNTCPRPRVGGWWNIDHVEDDLSALVGKIFVIDYGNSMLLTGDWIGSEPTFTTPSELWNIDTKMDDGKPASGKVVVHASNDLADCTNTAVTTNLAATYLLSATTKLCGLIFRQQF